MVYNPKCEVCGKDRNSSANLSFHRLPDNDEKRRIWSSLMGWSNICPNKKAIFICSDHFDPNDFVTRGEKRFLKQDANPLPQHSIFENSSISDNSSKTESSLSEQDKTFWASSYNPDESKPEQGHSSSTLTASEFENEASKVEFLEPNKDQMPTKKRKRKYIGDLSSSDFSTPEKRRRSLQNVKRVIAQQRTKIRTLTSKVRRQKHRIITLRNLVSSLNEKYRLTEGSQQAILASVPKTAGHIFRRMMGGPSRQKYDPSLRTFALTLAFYSPKAYNYVRRTFNGSLPHLGTISKWYQSVDGSPGFTKEALIAISLKKNDSTDPVMCNLVMDEMSIRQQIEWTGKKFTGYIDLGTNLDSDNLPEAREVLVFMLVCIHGSWKIPIGYFLLNGLSANEKAELVKKCLEFINESGVIITSLTFDGTSTNISMAAKLGVNFSDHSNLKTFFVDPISKRNIFIYLDACHMLKLVRNCFASQSGIKDVDGRSIEWNYVSKLVEMQNKEGLHSATKLRLRHLQWSREKMKVRLATQTLSKSVSDAMKFLWEDMKYPEFEGSEATAEFILNFNDLFDMLNSRNKFAKYSFKKAFSEESANFFLEFIEKMKIYILGLKLNNIPILQSHRKTGFLGLMVCMESLKKMYFAYVIEKKYLKYILTYKLSQDHLELFFGAIRSKGGYNNNPTARQFEASYKRLLIHNEIKASDSGNAINLEMVTILTCGSGKKITINESGENLEEKEEFLAFMRKTREDIENYSFHSSSAWNLTMYVEDVVTYISGFVIRGVLKCITCIKCANILEGNVTLSALQRQKTYGNLHKASEMVIGVCRAAEKYFRFYDKTTGVLESKSRDPMSPLMTNTMKNLPLTTFEAFGDHLYDDDPLEGHCMDLIKLLLKNYFKLRIHYETVKNLEARRKNRSRAMLTKLILFRNE